jgi:hypothetical protein
MPIVINAIGVTCIGMVCGYVLFYSLKRNQPPISSSPLPMSEVIVLLAAIAAGGAIGGAFMKLEDINYIGAYGIGLLFGVLANVFLTLKYEKPFK